MHIKHSVTHSEFGSSKVNLDQNLAAGCDTLPGCGVSSSGISAVEAAACACETLPGVSSAMLRPSREDTLRWLAQHS
jgi:hypothetical protein